MTRRISLRLPAAFAALAAAAALATACVKILPVGEPPRISKERLRDMLGKEDVVVVDVRHETFWNESPSKIPGAVRGDSKSVEWAKKYPKDAFLVLYCS